jgi:4-amino-4-deoxy-L-arabinose transferase-like glycosyltransferase
MTSGRVQPGSGRLVLGAGIPLLILAALAAVRIASRPALDMDEHIFLDVGQQIVTTGLPWRTYRSDAPHLFFDHTPLYVYLAAGVTAIGGPTGVILRAFSLVAAALSVVLVFRIGLEARGPVAGFVGAVILAATPFFATYAWFVRMEEPLCLCMVLAVWLLGRGRIGLAGLAIAAAVMLKELALAFWLVAAVWVLWRRGLRQALVVALPTPIALAAWFAYAFGIGRDGLLYALGRWGRSAAGSDPDNARFLIGPLRWTRILAIHVVGPVLGAATLVAAVIVARARGRTGAPAIAAIPLAYVVIAVAASYAMSLKEPRFVIGVVPMLALSVALLVDWDRLADAARARWAARRDPGAAPAA